MRKEFWFDQEYGCWAIGFHNLKEGNHFLLHDGYKWVECVMAREGDRWRLNGPAERNPDMWQGCSGRY